MNSPDGSFTPAPAIGEGDDPGRIFDLHAAEVHRFVAGLGIGLGHADAEDAVQETFLRFLRTAYDSRRPLRPYLLGIARHVAIDLARRPRAGPLDGDEPLAGSDEDVVASTARAEEREIVAHALAALDGEWRAAILLRHEHQLTMEELALALDCSVPTARARLREAAHAFARELRRRGFERHEVTP